MTDLQWTVVKLQQMLAERNTAECDASKRDAEHALCRIANESLVHDLMWVMDERDRLQAEVQRLQGEARQAQTGHDCALVAAYEAGLRAGQEAMRERAEALCRARAAEHLQCPNVGDWPVQVAYHLEAAKCARLITEMEVE